MRHICTLCSKEFKANKSNRKYCSKKCFEARNKESNKRVYLNCSKEFKTYPNWVKRGGGKFCSHKCHAIFESQKIEKTCQECGEVFLVKPSTIKHNAAKFCSHSCMWKGQLGKPIPSIQGENHVNWRGGTSGTHLYPSKFNDSLKELIRRRDDYKCQMCGLYEEEHLLIWGSSLQIHHIDYKKLNCDTVNLISLCNQCHGRTNYNRDYWEPKLKEVVKINRRLASCWPPHLKEKSNV